jgi:tetratricopeptide (TPR) repeat protein
MTIEYLGECHMQVPKIYMNQAKIYIMLGNTAQALDCLKTASRITSALEKRSDCGLLLPAELLGVYGLYYKFIGEYQMAVRCFEEAIAKYNNIYADHLSTTYKSHPVIASTLLDLADTQRLFGKQYIVPCSYLISLAM